MLSLKSHKGGRELSQKISGLLLYFQFVFYEVCIIWLLLDKMLILFYILMNSFSVNGLYLPSKGFSAANDTAEEIQHAICRISSKELQASANATLTRQLKGVCTSSYIQERLDEMQNKVLHQIEGIKSILESNGFVIPQSTESLEKQTVLIEKSLDHTEYSIADEISTFNDTVANSNKGSIYYYYWIFIK
ncbi:uncharacterized protein [Leptinotarsa decemlineata]|uniref:uncharacterized protein n=1 Tax=Leptinotarsa decemlineata TaxID=7539 RepID=UPI003D3079E7